MLFGPRFSIIHGVCGWLNFISITAMMGLVTNLNGFDEVHLLLLNVFWMDLRQKQKDEEKGDCFVRLGSDLMSH